MEGKNLSKWKKTMGLKQINQLILLKNMILILIKDISVYIKKMNFCDTCGFVLYKKLEDTGECQETISIKSKECKLFEYCKTCGIEKEITDDTISIYKRSYKNNFAVNNILSNKYIVYDNTLPRLKTPCKNTNCITNPPFMNLNKNNSLRVYNIPEDISMDDIRNILNGFSNGTSKQETTENPEYIKTIDGYKMFFKRIKLCSIVIYFKHDNPTPQMEEIIKNLTTYLKDLNTLDLFGQHERFSVEPFKTIPNEVLFVKYDPDNMKYLYMCVNCGTSW